MVIYVDQQLLQFNVAHLLTHVGPYGEFTSVRSFGYKVSHHKIPYLKRLIRRLADDGRTASELIADSG